MREGSARSWGSGGGGGQEKARTGRVRGEGAEGSEEGRARDTYLALKVVGVNECRRV